MAIKIQTKKTHIPIFLGDLELKFDITDESLISLKERMTDVFNVAKRTELSNDDKKANKQLKEVLKKAYDDLFGAGTFEKVYKISPSSVICAEYLAEIGKELEVEFDKMGIKNNQQQKANKYLQNKKKHNHNKNKQRNKRK